MTGPGSETDSEDAPIRLRTDAEATWPGHLVIESGQGAVTALAYCSLCSYTDYMTSYRDAAAKLWGEAGAYAYDAYSRLRSEFLPDLPAELPIVIGLTAYGHCIGLTRFAAEPRISLFSPLFGKGLRQVDDVLVHEMLHASLMLDGVNPAHEGQQWHDAINRLSPAVLGHEINVKRGAARKSVRIPNPDWAPGGSEPKTIVRKTAVEDAITLTQVARWPGAFRPKDYYAGDQSLPCPTY